MSQKLVQAIQLLSVKHGVKRHIQLNDFILRPQPLEQLVEAFSADFVLGDVQVFQARFLTWLVFAGQTDHLAQLDATFDGHLRVRKVEAHQAVHQVFQIQASAVSKVVVGQI